MGKITKLLPPKKSSTKKRRRLWHDGFYDSEEASEVCQEFEQLITPFLKKMSAKFDKVDLELMLKLELSMHMAFINAGLPEPGEKQEKT